MNTAWPLHLPSSHLCSWFLGYIEKRFTLHADLQVGSSTCAETHLGADAVSDDVDVLGHAVGLQRAPGGFLDGLLGCEARTTLEPHSPGQIDKALMAYLPASSIVQ